MYDYTSYLFDILFWLNLTYFSLLPTAAAKRAEAKKSAPKKTAPSAEEKKGKWWSMCMPPLIICVLYTVN